MVKDSKNRHILHINQFQGIGSTGRIMDELCVSASESGFDCYKACAFSVRDNDHTLTMEKLPKYWGARKNLLKSRITGLNGYASKNNTRRLIQWMDEINPSLIHLHNIHGNWINLEMLFGYIADRKIPVVWTLHDTWSFTGRCAILKDPICSKWELGCSKCPHLEVYPNSYFFDYSERMWKDKQKWINMLDALTIVSPSHWLDELVGKSYLEGHHHIVVRNGINIDTFHPVLEFSPYLKHIKDKKIILGVASAWSNDKGLGDFAKLSKMIDSENFQIVLVGVDERRKRCLPPSILCINRTNNVKELAQLYSSADVFLNPTYADNYPTVNLEALACGTPVVTYRTGGSPESVEDNTGIVIKQGDIAALWESAQSICNNKEKYSACRSYAEANFDKNVKYQEYVSLYRKILGI